MNEIMQIIKKRKSIRAYQDKALPAAVTAELLEAACNAPTARNLQQLEFKVITSQSLAQRLSDGIVAEVQKEMAAAPNPPPSGTKPHFFYKAPLVIIVTGPKDSGWTDADAALAIQNVMLYACSIGLGSCFIGMARLLNNNPALLKELHISADRRIAAAAVVGYAAEDPAPKEKFLKMEEFK
jgi:nitroreductase